VFRPASGITDRGKDRSPSDTTPFSFVAHCVALLRLLEQEGCTICGLHGGIRSCHFKARLHAKSDGQLCHISLSACPSVIPHATGLLRLDGFS
jgi:hypothetical protein